MRFTHGSWQILPLRARKNRRHVVRAPWGWYRAFGRIEAATWDRPKIEIDLEVTFRLCNKMTVSQRMMPFASYTPKTGLSQERTQAKDRIKQDRQTVTHSRNVPGSSLEQLKGSGRLAYV